MHLLKTLNNNNDNDNDDDDDDDSPGFPISRPFRRYTFLAI